MKAAATIKQDIPLPRWEEVSINHLIIQTYGRLKMKGTNDFAATADTAGHVRNDLAAVFVAPSLTSPQREGITKTKTTVCRTTDSKTNKEIMSYAEKIKEYLKTYKQQNFKNIVDGIFKGNGESYPHILPENEKTLNLLEKYRDDFLKYKDKDSEFKFHPCFHHLNSSQAMCINFFYPLIQENKLEFILKQLGLEQARVDYDSAKFEKKSDIEEKKNKGYRATTFDFYFETKSDKKLYFEIKYTEREFAKAKHDDDHKAKYEKVYKEAANGIIAENTEEYFLDNYQIMRNLIHLSKDSYVIFVVPEENKKVYKQAEDAKDLVKKDHKDKVKVLTWERLCGAIDEQKFEGKLKEHFSEFKEKYKF
jgi:hypothetical protein